MPISNTPTVIKPELAKRVVARLKSEGTMFPTAMAVTHVMEAIGAEIHSALMEGENVMLLGLGVLTLTTRKSRPGNNPLTGAALTIPAMYTARLKVSISLKRDLKLKMAADEKNAA